MSVNVFDRARSSAGKDAEIVDVKSIQMAYTASGDGKRFFEFALNDDYANLFLEWIRPMSRCWRRSEVRLLRSARIDVFRRLCKVRN